MFVGGVVAWFSPNAFRHSTDRAFSRDAQGRLVFWSGISRRRRIGHIVPNETREADLRAVTRKMRALPLVSVPLMIPVLAILVLLELPILRVLSLGPDLVFPIFNVVGALECLLIIFAMRAVMRRWERSATQGLTEISDPDAERVLIDEWLTDLLADMPRIVRWILGVVLVWCSYTSVRGILGAFAQYRRGGIESFDLPRILLLLMYLLSMWCVSVLWVSTVKHWLNSIRRTNAIN